MADAIDNDNPEEIKKKSLEFMRKQGIPDSEQERGIEPASLTDIGDVIVPHGGAILGAALPMVGGKAALEEGASEIAPYLEGAAEKTATQAQKSSGLRNALRNIFGGGATTEAEEGAGVATWTKPGAGGASKSSLQALKNERGNLDMNNPADRDRMEEIDAALKGLRNPSYKPTDATQLIGKKGK